MRCLIRVCIPQVLFRIIELIFCQRWTYCFSKSSGEVYDLETGGPDRMSHCVASGLGMHLFSPNDLSLPLIS